jgi:integrase
MQAKPIGGKRKDYPVAGARGLALRVTPGGMKSWSMRYRRQSDGKQRRLSLGTYPELSLKEARERARRVANEVSDGQDPAGAKQGRRAGVTFEELGFQWIAFKERQGRSYSYTKRSSLRLTSLPNWFRELKAGDIKRADVAKVLEFVAERGAKTETNRHQALVSAVLKWAVSEGYLEEDASHGLKRRFDESARTRVLTNEEVRKFWYGLDNVRASESTKIAMRLCFVLGQRPKEIAHLRQSKLTLDAEKPTATIEKTTSKNRVEHIVPLPDRAVELLFRALDIASGSQWVFPSPTNKGPIDPHTFSSVVQRARDPKDKTLFGMSDVQLYDAKKTIATFLGEAGHPNQVIGLLFNHLSAKEGTVTGKHYNHSTYMKTKRDLIEQWARHLDDVLRLPAA